MTEPASTERLRRQNVSLVLRSLRREGPATRTELAQRTGLAKATVGAIVSGLEDARAVLEEESRTGARGRPGRPVALRGDRYLALGLELNVDYVAAVLLDLAGDVQVVETRPAPTAPLAREQALLDLARDVAAPVGVRCSSVPRSRCRGWSEPTTGPSRGRRTSVSRASHWRAGSRLRWVDAARSG